MAINQQNPLDALSQTLPASWRGVPFPVASRECGWKHDQVKHAIFGKPVENIELTGLTGKELHYEIPFRNGVMPGPNEDALRGRILFPDLYIAFIDAFNEPTSGTLVDPLHGPLNCKAGSIHEVMSGDARDGVVVRVTFEQSDDSPEGSAPPVDTPAAITGIAQTADALDAQLADLTPPLTDDDGEPFTSFSQFGAALRAPFDSLSLLSTRLGNVIAGFTCELERLKDSVERANDVGLWPIEQSATELLNFLADIMLAGQREETKLRRFVVPRDMSLGAIMTFLHVDFDVLLQLNPTIADNPTVPEGTAVTYRRVD
jgi:hypothetical protein